MSLICDVFITTKNRPELLRRSLESFFKYTNKNNVRTTLVHDGGYAITGGLAEAFDFDYVLTSHENQGLGPSINLALAHIDTLNKWYDHPTHGDKSKVAPFICYCQDDILYTPGWLETLAKHFTVLEKAQNLGFASGHNAIEHSVKAHLHNGLLLKDWIRATNIFGRREYWMSMFPIPRYDPETRNVRAKPNDGVGSGVDWHFIRNHENSIVKSGRTCLVVPNLIMHLGYKDSSWLKRELPESEEDKVIIDEALCK